MIAMASGLPVNADLEHGYGDRPEDVARTVGHAVAAIDPAEDNRGPVAFKKHVAGVILGRAIARAWSRA